MKAFSHSFLLYALAALLCHSGHGEAKVQYAEAVEKTPERKQLIQAPEAGAARSVDLGDGVTLELVWIPPGVFRMGSKLSAEQVAAKYGGEPEHFADEHPQHEVTISKGFWMGKCEVTNAQYQCFKAGHSSKEHYNYKDHRLDGGQQPAVYVSWTEAQAFCEWLSDRTGERFMLPTEAQWEHACRAGTDTVRYGGDDDETMGSYANVADCTAKSEWGNWTTVDTTDGYMVTAPVGSLRPNAFGLFDMIGNVHEWCQDYYDSDYYGRSPAYDPCNTTAATSRVNRGGGWESTAEDCRAANRSGDDPDDHYSSVGFRVAAP